MYLDFPIEEIKFNFVLTGTGSIKIKLNGRFIEGYTINGTDLNLKNTLSLYFTKDNASDTESFATLTSLNINGGDFSDHIKSMLYQVDKSKHPDAPLEIQNNLYFGYNGTYKYCFGNDSQKNYFENLIEKERLANIANKKIIVGPDGKEREAFEFTGKLVDGAQQVTADITDLYKQIKNGS